MSVTDPLIIAPMADNVILATKAAKNPPEIVKWAKKNLNLVHARILGVPRPRSLTLVAVGAEEVMRLLK